MKQKMHAGLWFGVAALTFATGVSAEVRLPAIFGDHMVLQANLPIVVWGTADPEEAITVELGSDKMETSADADGDWKVSLPARASGTDLVLKTTGSIVLEFRDVAIGEVWVCSGRSNMAMLLKDCSGGAQDSQDAQLPMIRMFTVERVTHGLPQENFSGDWKVCTPDSAPDFSAVAFYFGRDLHHDLGVPIGLINSSWGGTRIEPWTTFDSLNFIPGFESEIEKITLVRENSDPLWQKYHDTLKERKDAMDVIAGIETNQALHLQMAASDLNDAAWPTMEVPGAWEKSGLPNFDGLVWFRKEVELPSDWAGKDLVLHLGPVDEMDSTWFNQTWVGKKGDLKQNITRFWDFPRVYLIPGNVVQAGRNVLMVRVIDTGYAGGLWGMPSEDMYLALADHNDERVSVAGLWRYQTGPQLVGEIAIPVNRGVPTTIYNAMIHPMISYAIRGVIWYQGESNLQDGSLYTHKTRALINGWRDAWKLGEFPFLFVQLAPFDYRNDDPFILPELWNAQREALRIPNTGMAVITDLGNLRDIHPRRKHEVGSRLAKWALAETYGRDTLEYSGPLVRSAVRDGSTVRVSFDHVGDGLTALEGETLSWFELAGADGVFVWAKAAIEGAEVVVSAGTVSEPAQVRYGWAKEAEVELRNSSGLPASPFRMDVQ